MKFQYPLSGDAAGIAAISNFVLDINRQPVLCLHGWLDNAASFIPLAHQMDDVPLVAIDFPGHGHSKHRGTDAYYYFFDWVQDVVTICRQQNWQQLTIIGHSMGGMVATALAAAFPELVAKIILIDSIGFVTDAPEHSAKQLREGITSRLKPASGKPYYASFVDAAAARQRQSDFSLNEAMILTERGAVATTAGVTWRADMRLRQRSVYRLTPEQAQALMLAVKCPVLAVLAKDGPFASQAFQAEYFSNLQLVWATGGHHCHMTQPADVAKAIQHFLRA
ncbi:alpha/beta hydrolase [Rheinheimera baltica]|uniref:Alpha/beta hydrolase n=1 Tax=Rheinheimera baltica TaxID=67576 RepID=A0ABT9I226_9GAMM|nr:alpha/beta hydrolase [Rheinheimera baltica]MDP5137223.1 alpha/beta hydrolase [Rheinheimera baltica]